MTIDLPIEVKPLGPLLRSRAGAAKASFWLGLALYMAAFAGFLFYALAAFPLSAPWAGLFGFATGLYYLILGIVWAALWALVVNVNLLVAELTAWIAGLMRQSLALVRTHLVGGVIVDLQVVQSTVEALVAEQTARLDTEGAWAPLVNQWAPVAVRGGLRIVVTRVAGNVWLGDKLTVETVERRVAELTSAYSVAEVRRVLFYLMLGWLALAALVAGLPYGIAALAMWIF
jgi:hypothetical protein